jgi:hypothetical protein
MTPRQIIDAITPKAAENVPRYMEYYRNRVSQTAQQLTAACAATEAARAAKEEKAQLKAVATKSLNENGIVPHSYLDRFESQQLNASRSRLRDLDSACQNALSKVSEAEKDLVKARARAEKYGGDHSAAIAAIQKDIKEVREEHRKVYEQYISFGEETRELGAKLESVFIEWKQANREYDDALEVWEQKVTAQQSAETESAKAKAEAAVPFATRLRTDIIVILSNERPKVLAKYREVRGHVGGGGCYAYYGIDYEPGAAECARMAAAGPYDTTRDKIDDAIRLLEKGAPIIVPVQADAAVPAVNAGAGGGPAGQ